MTAREHANNIREKLVAQRDRQLLVVANEIIVRLGCIEDVSTRRELAINYSELVNACARPDSVEEIRAILATQESLADKFGLEIEFAAEFPNILGVDIAPLHMAAQAVFTIQEAHFMGQSLRCERNMDAQLSELHSILNERYSASKVSPKHLQRLAANTKMAITYILDGETAQAVEGKLACQKRYVERNCVEGVGFAERPFANAFNADLSPLFAAVQEFAQWRNALLDMRNERLAQITVIATDGDSPSKDPEMAAARCLSNIEMNSAVSH